MNTELISTDYFFNFHIKNILSAFYETYSNGSKPYFVAAFIVTAVDATATLNRLFNVRSNL